MKTSEPIIVCGLGRCGTSLVMKMLHAGGMPVFAESSASFEHSYLRDPREFALVEPQLQGKAAKILDPHRWTWPEKINARFIWIDRNYHQQALSQVKLLRDMFAAEIPAGAVAGIERQLPSDCAKSMAVINRGISVLRINFEWILRNPLEVALLIGCEFECLSVPKMADCVIPRSPRCAVGLSIELDAADNDFLWGKRNDGQEA